MTPSISLLLAVALFWTLPASVAAIAYQRYDGSLEQMGAALDRSWEAARSSVRTDDPSPLDA